MKTEYEKARGDVISAQAFHASQEEGEGAIVQVPVEGGVSRLRVRRRKPHGNIVFDVVEHPYMEGTVEVTPTLFPPDAFPSKKQKDIYILAHGADPWEPALFKRPVEEDDDED